MTAHEYVLERLDVYAFFYGQVHGVLESLDHGTLLDDDEALNRIREALAETEAKLAALEVTK